jgi:hypothetical protein
MRQSDPLANLTVAAASAYDSDYTEDVVRALDINAVGDLFVEDVEGNTVHYTFSAALLSPLPYRLHLKIRKIIGDGAGAVGDGTTGTDIALADLIVLH